MHFSIRFSFLPPLLLCLSGEAMISLFKGNSLSACHSLLFVFSFNSSGGCARSAAARRRRDKCSKTRAAGLKLGATTIGERANNGSQIRETNSSHDEAVQVLRRTRKID